MAKSKEVKPDTDAIAALTEPVAPVVPPAESPSVSPSPPATPISDVPPASAPQPASAVESVPKWSVVMKEMGNFVEPYTCEAANEYEAVAKFRKDCGIIETPHMPVATRIG